MKRKLQNIIVASGLLFLAACGGSESPEPPHVAGSWDLENYIVVDLPSTYSRSAGITLEVNELTIGGFPISSYDLDISADGTSDGTFIRKIGFTGSPSSNSQGTWEISSDGEDLTITTDGADVSEDWEVVRNELDQLWITLPASLTISLISDATWATLEAEHGTGTELSDYLAGLTNEELAVHTDDVTADLMYAFARE